MPGSLDSLAAWARRTTTSFTELLSSGFGREDMAPEEPEPAAPGEPIYRLKQWPRLSSALKTADVFRTLSVMSNRPVNRRWILSSSKMRPEQVDSLIARLIEQGAVEVIDTARFAPSQPG
jgi:hypothetical protein